MNPKLNQLIQEARESLSIKLYNLGRMSDIQELSDAQEDIEEVVMDNLDKAFQVGQQSVVENANQRNAVSTQGEWCDKCGAWKTYGITDSHNCTGYKITS